MDPEGEVQGDPADDQDTHDDTRDGEADAPSDPCREVVLRCGSESSRQRSGVPAGGSGVCCNGRRWHRGHLFLVQPLHELFRKPLGIEQSPCHGGRRRGMPLKGVWKASAATQVAVGSIGLPPDRPLDPCGLRQRRWVAASTDNLRSDGSAEARVTSGGGAGQGGETSCARNTSQLRRSRRRLFFPGSLPQEAELRLGLLSQLPDQAVYDPLVHPHLAEANLEFHELRDEG